MTTRDEDIMWVSDVGRLLGLKKVQTYALLNRWNKACDGRLLTKHEGGRTFTTRARLAEFLPGLVKRTGSREMTEAEFVASPDRALDWCEGGQLIITRDDGRRAMLMMADKCSDAPSAWLPTNDPLLDMPDPEFDDDGHLRPIVGHTLARGDVDYGPID